MFGTTISMHLPQQGKIGSGMPSAVSFRRLIEESKCLIAVDGKFQCDQRPYET
jgi:hypothetical protein